MTTCRATATDSRSHAKHRIEIHDLVLPIILAALLAPVTASAGQWTMRLDLRGRRIEATPVFWSEREILVLGRDGQYWQFAPDEAEDYSKVSDRFRSYSQAEMRGQLLREFGRAFDVSGTGHYLVVHPAGKRDVWAESLLVPLV